MRELPTGRLTLLFTDVEGSTRLLHELGDGYGDVLAEHRRVLRAAFEEHGGIEVDTQGDAFFYVFREARDAVAAAAEGCERLSSGPVRVRIGIHTGAPTVTDEGYVGLDVHLAARIGAAGHGGQVVISATTCGELGDAFELLELGDHRVKDFDDPVTLFQLGGKTFPPLKTISNTNLPRPATSFVGRAADVTAVVERIRDGARLLTLTGPGGSGKSRLALEAAAELVPEFPGGVFWVELAPLRNPALVLETIGRTIGARDEVAVHVGERRLLLVLDNFEQLVDAAPGVGALVSRCPNLHVLVTSRELLRLRDETGHPVPPLEPPEAARLFAERSGLPADDTVSELCVALDNLPLAVELAAARTDVLSPRQILDRLGRRLDLFHGARDADPRQKTLRAAIQWSHELLDENEQRLFAHLAVFPGGCTLEAAEDVAGADLDTLEALVQKSLVRHAGERFWMLETIRDYALERLAETDAAEAVRERHGEWFAAFAERAATELDGTEQADWLDRLEADYDNIRAALRRPELTARLVVALRLFWAKRGYPAEGRRVVARLLPSVPDTDAARPMLLATASLLATLEGDWEAAIASGEECLALSRRVGDEPAALQAAPPLARALLAAGEKERALALLTEAAGQAREQGRAAVAAIALLNLGYLALVDGDTPAASEHLRHAAEVGEECGDLHAVARAHAGLASAALEEGQPRAAWEHAARSIELAGPAQNRDTLCWALELAGAALATAEPERAARLLGAAAALREELGTQLRGLEQAQHERTESSLAAALGPALLADGLERGRALPLAELLRLAVQQSRPARV